MSTFLIKSKIKITRQSGDDFEVIFNIPALIPLTDATLKFGVFSKNVFDKTKATSVLSKAGSDITIDGQKATIPFNSTETLNKFGVFIWELEVTIGGKISTIGTGDFELIKTVIE